ncbi:DUF4173 domain-containing protein [Hathewaya histolytica]|uniref:Membrane protein n=2 Tax=Hathewaya histolytica TaxID=1498 RepID=A0A4U9RBR5_HATHI|nr:DUF4173 domain-containing protein [Hathewaya histolytica]VTQ89114.1 membrane protein [Hathewaya histolytica]
MKEMLSKEEIKSNLKILFTAIFIGFLVYNFIFYYMGLSYPILIAALIIGFLVTNGIKNKNPMGFFLIAVSIILSLTYAIYTNPIFRFLNRIIIPLSLTSSFLLLTYKDIRFEFKVIYRSIIKKVFIESLYNIKIIRVLIKSLTKQINTKEDTINYRDILLGLLISIPLIFMLVLILGKADKVFEYYIENLSSSINNEVFGKILLRTFLSILASIFIFGLYNSFSINNIKVQEDIKYSFKFNSLVVITTLSIVTFIYISFTKIQISYLYGSKSLPNGFNYSEYARSGFFQLVFLVFVNVVSIILIKNNTKSKGKLQKKILLTLYSLITVLTFNMVFSALYKMRLYIVAFGFTRLRILVIVFTVFLGIILVLVLFFIFKDINLFKSIIILGAVMYIVINFTNIDNFITRENINIAKNSTEIDNTYLTSLSFDSYMTMKNALKKGEISMEQYHNWVYNNKIEINYWHEYNYFNSKGNSIK